MWGRQSRCPRRPRAPLLARPRWRAAPQLSLRSLQDQVAGADQASARPLSPAWGSVPVRICDVGPGPQRLRGPWAPLGFQRTMEAMPRPLSQAHRGAGQSWLPSTPHSPSSRAHFHLWARRGHRGHCSPGKRSRRAYQGSRATLAETPPSRTDRASRAPWPCPVHSTAAAIRHPSGGPVLPCDPTRSLCRPLCARCPLHCLLSGRAWARGSYSAGIAVPLESTEGPPASRRDCAPGMPPHLRRPRRRTWAAMTVSVCSLGGKSHETCQTLAAPEGRPGTGNAVLPRAPYGHRRSGKAGQHPGSRPALSLRPPRVFPGEPCGAGCRRPHSPSLS